MSITKVKILFLGSRKLAENILGVVLKNTEICEVKGLVMPMFEGWWEDELEELARLNNIPIYNQIEDTLHLDYDLMLSVNYWKLIPLEFLSKVKGNAVNIHHSYKLKFKGRYSTSWAIMHARRDNCWEHGTTIHYIDESLDNGRIIATEKVAISEMDTAETLFMKVEELAVSVFKNAFAIILSGSNESIMPSKITYTYDRFSKDNLQLPDPVSLIELYDFARAWTFKGRPSATFKLPNEKSIIIGLKD